MDARRYVALAALSALALAAPGGGQEAKPPEQGANAKPEAAAGLQWIDGWEAGRAEARRRKQLMLVYVPHHQQSEELTRDFEDNIFRDVRHGEIAARCVPVRIQVNATQSPEAKDFLRRYEVQAFPALFVMNADGHLLVGGMRRTADSVLRSLTRAEEDEMKFGLATGKTDPAGQAEVRRLLLARRAWEEAIPLLAAEVAKVPTSDLLVSLAHAYQCLGRGTEERSTLALAVEKFPHDPSAPRWRMRIATLHLDALDDQPDEFAKGTIAALEPLAKALGEEGNKLGEAEVRLVLGNSHAGLHQFPEARREYDATIALTPDQPPAAKALMGKASICWYEYDYRGCRALCLRVVEEFPDSGEAWAAKGTIEQCDERMKTEKR
jgi:hypothetical protein